MFGRALTEGKLCQELRPDLLRPVSVLVIRTNKESTMPAFPHIHIGDPSRHKDLTVFPLFTQANGSAEYLLSDEALAAGTVTVEEWTEAGSVPKLIVTNQSNFLVLFIEGEELRGAKQNRVLNTSVLAAAKSRTTIPVSCVEQGRWRYRSRTFASAGSHASSKLRRILKRSVHHSVQEGLGHGSDQREVWREVSRQMEALGSVSATSAMADTYERYRHRLAEFQERLPYVAGATGLAVAVGGKVLSIDLFDKPATCRKVWNRLLTGFTMDALEAEPALQPAQVEDVQLVLMPLRTAAWQRIPPVGAGEEFRFETPDGKAGSALLYNGSVIHGSLILAG